MWDSGQGYKWRSMHLISKYLKVINKPIKPLNKMFDPLTLQIYLHTTRKFRFEFTIFGQIRVSCYNVVVQGSCLQTLVCPSLGLHREGLATYFLLQKEPLKNPLGMGVSIFVAWSIYKWRTQEVCLHRLWKLTQDHVDVDKILGNHSMV